MKRLTARLLVFCVVSIIFVSCSKDKPSSVFEKDLDGFRGIKWGTKLSSLENMTCINKSEVPEDQEFKLCAKNDDTPELGGAKLKSIQYLFLKDELIKVFIKSDSSNSDALKRIVLEKLGNPTFVDKEDYKREIYRWKRSMTDTLFEKSEEKGFLLISDINAQQKEEDYKNQIAKKGAEKGF